MRVILSVQALFDDGEVAWNYSHEENVVGKTAEVDYAEAVAAMRRGEPLPEEIQQAMEIANRQSAGETLDKICEELERARDSILQQAAADMVGGSDASPGS